jgi:hypothetical protein
MPSDLDPQPVQFVKPDALYRPDLAVDENDGSADQLGLRRLECVSTARTLRGNVARAVISR